MLEFFTNTNCERWQELCCQGSRETANILGTGLATLRPTPVRDKKCGARHKKPQPRGKKRGAVPFFTTAVHFERTGVGFLGTRVSSRVGLAWQFENCWYGRSKSRCAKN